MHAARGALEKHQQLLDASLSAVEAAAAKVQEAVSQKKLLETWAIFTGFLGFTLYLGHFWVQILGTTGSFLFKWFPRLSCF